MKRSCFSAIVIFFCMSSLWTLEPPTDTPAFIRLFGQRIEGSAVEQGLTFEKSDAVRAADHGILLITLDTKSRSGSFPSTLGNAAVLLHDDGLQTIYGNLENTHLLQNRSYTETKTVIGRTGSSGWGTPQALIFQVSDIQKQVYINPLLLLPAIEDNTAPHIQNVFLVSERNTAIPAAGQKNIRQGTYELYADISDTVTAGGRSFSPFRISVFVNGTTVRIIPFETILQKQGFLHLGNTALTDTLLYRRPQVLYLGKIMLNRGKCDLLITARDITGNEKSELFPLQVE
ncbi:MAG: peptidoglycan DD-metalloendopeptidase family protein [Treponema sp.]